MESEQPFFEEVVLQQGNVVPQSTSNIPASVVTKTSKLEADCLSFIENKWKLTSIIFQLFIYS